MTKVLSEHQANRPLDLGSVANEVMRTTHYCTNAQPTARLVPRQPAVMAAVVKPFLQELTKLDKLDMRTPHLGAQRHAVPSQHLATCCFLLPHMWTPQGCTKCDWHCRLLNFMSYYSRGAAVCYSV